MYDLAVETCTQIVQYAMPIAILFELTNIACATFLRVAFGGKLWFGR